MNQHRCLKNNYWSKHLSNKAQTIVWAHILTVHSGKRQSLFSVP